MSNYTRLRYTPIQVGAGATVKFTSNSIGGFLCVTSGSITVTAVDDFGNSVTVVPVTAVTAGTWLPLPFYLGTQGGTIVSSGGAVGVLGV